MGTAVIAKIRLRRKRHIQWISSDIECRWAGRWSGIVFEAQVFAATELSCKRLQWRCRCTAKENGRIYVESGFNLRNRVRICGVGCGLLFCGHGPQGHLCG